LLLAFDLGLAPREGTTAQKIVAQEISKPEELVRIGEAFAYRLRTNKLQKVMVPLWVVGSHLVAHIPQDALLILISMVEYETDAIPQEKMKTVSLMRLFVGKCQGQGGLS